MPWPPPSLLSRPSATMTPPQIRTARRHSDKRFAGRPDAALSIGAACAPVAFCTHPRRLPLPPSVLLILFVFIALIIGAERQWRLSLARGPSSSPRRAHLAAHKHSSAGAARSGAHAGSHAPRPARPRLATGAYEWGPFERCPAATRNKGARKAHLPARTCFHSSAANWAPPCIRQLLIKLSLRRERRARPR